VTVCSSAFESLGRAQAKALGQPNLPILRIAHPFGNRSRTEVETMARECVDQLATLVAKGNPQETSGQASAQGAHAAASRCERIEIAGDVDAVNRLFRSRRWSDGLPVVAPTPERVERMLQGVLRAPQSVIASVAPAFGAATLEAIAVNAVASGCEPEYLPLLIAAVQAVAEPQFNLQAIQATTNSVAVWVIVNGPAAQQLEVNAGMNCLGQGTWANATIGRALRLILQNIGGAVAGEMDRATHGQPGKYSFCCAENEIDSPWESLHVERGFARSQNTVTVVGAEGTMNMNTHTKDADQLLRVFAETMQHPPSNEYTHGGEPWLILCPEHANVLQHAGLSKADVKQELWERSRMPARRMADRDLLRVLESRKDELGPIGPDTLLPIAQRPEGIGLIVAGGPGTHSVYVPCFGNSLAVTQEIT
jgi:hypothetical protein